MAFIPRQLQDSYAEILRLVQSGAPHDEDFARKFELQLNAALPLDGDKPGRACYDLIRGLYHRDRREFVQYMRKVNLPAFVLWSDGKELAKFFGLDKNLFFRWNADISRYTVRLHNQAALAPRPPRRNRGPRRPSPPQQGTLEQKLDDLVKLLASEGKITKETVEAIGIVAKPAPLPPVQKIEAWGDAEGSETDDQQPPGQAAT
jgi:hypothetical protein